MEVLFKYLVKKRRQLKTNRRERPLTVGRHAHRYALLESTFLALVSRHSVDDAFPLVLTSVGGVQVLLDGPPEEPLRADDGKAQRRTRGGESTRETGRDVVTLQPSHVMQR